MVGDGQSVGTGRRDECRCGTDECVRHIDTAEFVVTKPEARPGWKGMRETVPISRLELCLKVAGKPKRVILAHEVRKDREGQRV
jgi:hypothetical protein